MFSLLALIVSYFMYKEERKAEFWRQDDGGDHHSD